MINKVDIYISAGSRGQRFVCRQSGYYIRACTAIQIPGFIKWIEVGTRDGSALLEDYGSEEHRTWKRSDLVNPSSLDCVVRCLVSAQNRRRSSEKTNTSIFFLPSSQTHFCHFLMFWAGSLISTYESSKSSYNWSPTIIDRGFEIERLDEQRQAFAQHLLDKLLARRARRIGTCG